MKTYKRLMTVAMAGIIAASVSLPAFADVVHATMAQNGTDVFAQLFRNAERMVQLLHEINLFWRKFI